MIVYVVEETRETDWQDFERRNAAVYETESEALEKIKQLREQDKNKYNGKFYIMYQDILQEQELKNVYKVVEIMEDCNSLQRELYRGEILKRGIEVNVVREATINKKGEIKKWIYY